VEKKTISFITDVYWPARGGVEYAVRELASHVSHDFQVEIATHSDGRCRKTMLGQTVFLPRLQPYYDPGRIEVHPLVPDLAGRIKMLPIVAWHLPFIRRCYASGLYDRLYVWYRQAFLTKIHALVKSMSLVHCFSTGYLARCVAEVCHDLRIPLLFSPYIHFGRWGDSPALMKAYGSAGTVICPSTFFRRKFLGLYPECKANLEVIPPVIRSPSRPCLPRAPVARPFVLFLGRREAHKGLAMLLVAFGGLGHLAKLAVAGPGDPVRTRFDSITDLGEVDDQTRDWLLANCELLCVPSMDETFGLVYAEAMSYGKPVVALNTPPIDEIVINEQTGILVRPDDTDGLRMAIARLLLDSDLRSRMGKAAQRHFETTLAADKIAERMLGIYRKMLAH
jgi:glycosyltransferase involved in cell wall biosynthesis